MLSRRTVLAAGFGAVVKAQDSDMFADARGSSGRFGRIPEQGQILDVGSGTGALALAMTELHPQCRVVGVDLSHEYVEFARSRAQNDRVRFETARCPKSSICGGLFRCGRIAACLQLHPQSGKSPCRVTRPGGFVSAAVWDYGQGMRMLRLFWDAAAALDPAAGRLDEKHMPLSRKRELYELWTRGGLEQVEEARRLRSRCHSRISMTSGILSCSARGRRAHMSSV